MRIINRSRRYMRFAINNRCDSLRRLPQLIIGLCLTAGCVSTPPTKAPAVTITALDLNTSRADARYAVSTRPDRIGRIVAPVTINGTGPYQFMLDTGANRTVITAELLMRMGLEVNNGDRVIVHGVTQSVIAPVVTLNDLQSGEVDLQNLRAPVLDGSILSSIDGILGMDGLANKKVTADFVNDRVQISQSQNEPADLRFAVVHFDLLSQRLMMVNARIGRIAIKAVIDTGGTHTLGNPALLNALLEQRRRYRRNANSDEDESYESGVTDITNHSQPGRVMLAPRINLGNAALSNVQVTFSDFRIFHIWKLDNEPALLIGMDVLGLFDELAIDYGRKELHLRAH